MVVSFGFPGIDATLVCGWIAISDVEIDIDPRQTYGYHYFHHVYKVFGATGLISEPRPGCDGQVSPSCVV